MSKQSKFIKKRKKATYLRRKEEHDALTDQVCTLQNQLTDIQTQLNGGDTERRELLQTLQLNQMLVKAAEQNALRVATTQSLMSEWMQNLSGNPMGVHIHLPRKRTERRNVVLEVKDERLQRGFRYVTVRCQHLSPLKPHKSEEHFEDINGDFCCVVNEVIPLPGMKSMRKVFEAIKYSVSTLEISISEQLGDITVREDYDTVDTDSFASNYRLTSTRDGGITTELNTVAFGQYTEGTGINGDRSFAVFAFDSVDQDDIYPYHPRECVRKDINGTNVLLAVPRNNVRSNSEDETADEDEIVIVMLRSFFFRTHRPKFKVSEAMLQDLRRNVSCWGEVYIQGLRRMLYADS